MKARVQLSNLSSERGKMTIIRNLSRIMDIRIVEIDLKERALSFLYQNNKAYEDVKKELKRIGHPIEKVLLTIRGNKRRMRSSYDNWEASFD